METFEEDPGMATLQQIETTRFKIALFRINSIFALQLQNFEKYLSLMQKIVLGRHWMVSNWAVFETFTGSIWSHRSPGIDHMLFNMNHKSGFI